MVFRGALAGDERTAMYGLVHLASVVLLPIGVACLMMLAGVHKNALEWKRPTRICPSCNRETHRCRCRG